MSKRTPAISTQLKAAQTQIEKLEKDLKAANDAKALYDKRNDEARGEIEQVHILLDALPNAVARKTEHEDSWQRKDLNLMTRLAAWLATRPA